MSPALNGAEFILDAAVGIPAIWGHGSEVLAAEGEMLLLVGPSGIGKSTVAQQVTKGRLLAGHGALGYPITPGRKRVLYIAADRPAQIQRSMKRPALLGQVDRQTLSERLTVWRGPLPFSLVNDPKRLLAMAQHYDADTVIVDSLKDVASPLSDEKVGAAITNAHGFLTEAGIWPVFNHHQRKSQAENRKPTKLDDVYGSAHIPNGAGSVVLLWGQPGDPVIEIRHLKQPADEVGPLTAVHDHLIGETTLQEQTSAYDLLMESSTGVEVKDVARRVFGSAKPTRNEIEKTRRKLEQLVADGRARKVPGSHEKDPAIYVRVMGRDTDREASRPDHANPETPENTDHAGITQHHAPLITPHHPLKGGGRDSHHEALDLIEEAA